MTRQDMVSKDNLEELLGRSFVKDYFPGLCAAEIICGLDSPISKERIKQLEKGGEDSNYWRCDLKDAIERRGNHNILMLSINSKQGSKPEIVKHIKENGFFPVTPWIFNTNSGNYVRIFMWIDEKRAFPYKAKPENFKPKGCLI